MLNVTLPPLLLVVISSLCLVSWSLRAVEAAGPFRLPPGDDVFGVLRDHVVADDGETLAGLAVRWGLGYNEMTEANEGVDPWYPGKGRSLVIPTSWILPDISAYRGPAAEGARIIVLNLAELRLYVIVNEAGRRSVSTFPVGIGREGYDTPLGRFTITEKLKDPPWIIPPSFRDEYRELPDIVPPGPDNPLGRYALRLSDPLYLIHGTNKPLGVGRRVSHGCIRMYPEDIERLYGMTGVGDEVIILYQPVKVGLRGTTPYIEVHRDYLHNREPFQEAVDLLRRRGLLGRIDPGILYPAILEKRGIPVRLTSPE